MRDKLLNPWAYDEALAAIADVRKAQDTNIAETKRTLSLLTRALQANPPRPGSERAYTDVTRALENLEQRSKFTEEYRARLGGAAVFLVGPATLESLLTAKPETYDALVQAHLPFPNMFFEFRPSGELELPFLNRQASLLGLYFGRFDTSESDDRGGVPLDATTTNRYVCTAHLKIDGQFDGLNFTFTSAEPHRLQGELGNVEFLLDAHKGVVSYHEHTDDEAPKDPRLSPYDKSAPLRRITHGDTLLQVSNLGINLVNYINAHNVTIVKRTRSLDIVRRNERNKRKHVQEQKPFYMVTIRDRYITEPEEATGKSWELQWRLWVIGHPWHYRDAAGERHTLWIEPYIKGPPNAPWREHRYALLADKLEQERQLYDEFLKSKK